LLLLGLWLLLGLLLRYLGVLGFLLLYLALLLLLALLWWSAGSQLLCSAVHGSPPAGVVHGPGRSEFISAFKAWSKDRVVAHVSQQFGVCIRVGVLAKMHIILQAGLHLGKTVHSPEALEDIEDCEVIVHWQSVLQVISEGEVCWGPRCAHAVNLEDFH
jgi:hypothetical protein